MRSLLKGTALLMVGVVVVTNCANTYNVRAEAATCTETRRSCVAECATEACVAACSADERACFFTVEKKYEAAEGAAERQTTGLLAGLRGGLHVVGLVFSTIVLMTIMATAADYIDTLE